MMYNTPYYFKDKRVLRLKYITLILIVEINLESLNLLSRVDKIKLKFNYEVQLWIILLKFNAIYNECL